MSTGGNLPPDQGAMPPERSAGQLATEMVIALSQERQRLRDGLRDLLAMWDRRETDLGWTPAEVSRLEEIRKLL